MTPVSTEVTVSATGEGSTRRQGAGRIARSPTAAAVEPPAPAYAGCRTATSAYGGQCVPRAAKVAYAPAIASGVTSLVPRVNDGTRCSGLPLARRTPIASARAAGARVPVRSCSCMYQVLTLSQVASSRVKTPDSESAAFATG